MFCEHCGDVDGDETGIDHDERDCPWYDTDDGAVTIDAAELADILQAVADGSPALRAATGLLIDHGLWIKRLAERPGLLLIDDSGPDPEPYGIDWLKVVEALAVNDLPASSGELRILAIAASLADTAARIPLGDAVSGLDATNLDRVLTAIAEANGRPLAR
ncbi:hypothetical protein [Streptomyces sp. NL15-2K]|uniref:hypothetical protein n=1 Tax=Streptomyces sp. NL15-2K TaxID=376149 RepID=UPI000F586D72|nr:MULTISPECIES: hypothetical protein [Actinomycetes]WKX11351.1 hypothetical protein Q4V64_29080 [Kutzneria buriramensis]GCB47240.1 hypothetical protein SNL152K_4544 [Streptomyces sp. NL15-2K]